MIRMMCDNMSTIRTTYARGVGRMKHLGIKYLSLQDMVRSGELLTSYVPSAQNPAGLPTKPVVGSAFL